MPIEAAMSMVCESMTSGASSDCRHLLGHLARRAAAHAGGDQHRELVAAQARHDVGIAQRRAHARAHLAQCQVAHRMAERVVDRLEPVHVEEQDREQRAVPPGVAQRLLELAMEHRAVRQPREAVLVGEAQDLALAALDAVEHQVEALGERADLVLAVDVDVALVVAALHALRGLGQARHGTRDAAGDHETADDQHDEAGERQPEEPVADAPEGREAHLERLLQHRDDRGAPDVGERGGACLVALAAELERAERREPRHRPGERVAQVVAQLRRHRRGVDLPGRDVDAAHERHLEARSADSARARPMSSTSKASPM
jgi:hypothetical protein